MCCYKQKRVDTWNDPDSTEKKPVIGAIAGDIVGSVYERRPIKTKDFPLFDPRCRFTDDTVLTVAVADAILSGSPYFDSVRRIGRRHPDAGYGGSFFRWLFAEDTRPYNSWGNGSAMRVSPVGFAFSTEDEVLRQARMTAEITHDHPEGIRGAEAVALAIFLARTGHGKAAIRLRITDRFGYDLDQTIDDIRPSYVFDVSCQGTVPQAIVAFLDSDSYEDAVRNAISLGGDSDTLACIAGGIAEAFYGNISGGIRARVKDLLTPDLWEVTNAFCAKYIEKS
jgi:ADP-ribosylglycohydrolase